MTWAKVIYVGLSVFVVLVALYWQFMIVGLSASADAYGFEASLGLFLIAIVGGPALVITFLVCLFGGVRWAVLVTGWALVFQLLLGVLVLVTLCEPARRESSWNGYVPVLDQNPHAAGIILGAMALVLSVVLVKARRWARLREKRISTAEPAATSGGDGGPIRR